MIKWNKAVIMIRKKRKRDERMRSGADVPP